MRIVLPPLRTVTFVCVIALLSGFGAFLLLQNKNELATPRPVEKATLPEGFTATVVVDGRWRLSALAFLSGGEMVYGEKETGKVFWAKRKDDQWTPAPEPLVTLADCASDDKYCERGLCGLTGWKDKESGKEWLYIYYTLKAIGAEKQPTKNQIVRFPITREGETLKAGTSEVVIPGDILSAGWNHNGGGIVFGPDGMLYFSNGENGKDGVATVATASKSWEAQNYKNLRGVIARVSQTGEALADNPFVEEGAGREQKSIFAYGLRNTYRIAFDPVKGALFGTENGPNDWDELNIIPRGGNLGWPLVRGRMDDPHNAKMKPHFKPAPGSYADPIDAWARCPSVTGIAFEPGAVNFPAAYKHELFVAAYLGSIIWRVTLDESRTKVVSREQFFSMPSPDRLPGAGIADMAFGPDGKLYLSTTTYDGDNKKNDRVIMIEWKSKAAEEKK